MLKKSYIPALRFEFLTKFYDPLVRHTTREKIFKDALIKQAKLSAGHEVLDLACGTGTLSICIKKKFPSIAVTAYDIDYEILQMGVEKAKRAHVEIDFQQGSAVSLPFEEGQFDRVFSTLAFHHLTPAEKNQTLREVWRVLKTGGEFHLADYALPRNKSQFVLSKWIRLIDGYETTRDNLRGRLKDLIEQAGFAQVKRTEYFQTIIGTIRLFKAVKK